MFFGFQATRATRKVKRDESKMKINSVQKHLLAIGLL